jgi:hypothetical protein
MSSSKSIQDYILSNKAFWSFIKPKDSSDKILVEESTIPAVTHPMAMFTIVLNQAKGYVPVWLFTGKQDEDLVRSYLPNSQTTPLARLPFFFKFFLLIRAGWEWLIMVFSCDILSFHYDHVKYGDICYDTYLSEKETGTIKRPSLHMMAIIYRCIRRHEQIRRVLRSGNFKAVLVSHLVNIQAAVMLRVAIRYGYLVYSRTGHHQSSLLCFDKDRHLPSYPNRPRKEDVKEIIDVLGNKFDETYQFIFGNEVSGKGSKDGLLAYSEKNTMYADRQIFNQEFSLDSKKKNIFVMLHAFNDGPHSHFNWMIFKDYQDWFLQTLQFAKKYPYVNWIFKQHPSIKLYPLRNFSFEKMFEEAPKNIVYISEQKQIDTRSLTVCADCVLTCLGSAGFQLPAMARIPSLIAADNHYLGLGFAMEPQNREDYFRYLRKLDNVQPLTEEQQKLAQAAYMYIHYFSRVHVSACPILSVDDEKSADMNSWYWPKVMDLYSQHSGQIKEEMLSYVKDVADPHFFKLSSLKSHQTLFTS